jgi:hypothetical protein
VDYGPVVFPSHIGKVFHVKIVSCACGVWIYIFHIYIALCYSFLQIHTKREFCVLLFLPTHDSCMQVASGGPDDRFRGVLPFLLCRGGIQLKS